MRMTTKGQGQGQRLRALGPGAVAVRPQEIRHLFYVATDPAGSLGLRMYLRNGETAPHYGWEDLMGS